MVDCSPPQPIPATKPDPVYKYAVRQLCVKNNGGFALQYDLTVDNRQNPVVAHSGTFVHGNTKCIEGSQVTAEYGDQLGCEAHAIAGKTMPCVGGDESRYDARSSLQANYECAGTTLSFSCAFKGLTTIPGDVPPPPQLASRRAELRSFPGCPSYA